MHYFVILLVIAHLLLGTATASDDCGDYVYLEDDLWYSCRDAPEADAFCAKVAAAADATEAVNDFPCLNDGTHSTCQEQSLLTVYIASAADGAGACHCYGMDTSSGCPLPSASPIALPDEGGSDPYAYLERLSLADLKKLLHDKSGGTAQVDKYTSEAAIIKVIINREKHEDAIRVLKERSAVAMENRKKANSKRLKPQSHNVEIRVCKASGFESRAKEIHAEWVLPNRDELNITVTSYPVPLGRMIGSAACRLGFAACIGVGVVGQQILPPSIMERVSQRRGLLLSTGMVLNAVAGTVAQSGAFEVYVDGVLVYSKLETGKLPQSVELNRIVLEKTLLDQWEQ